MNKFFSVQTILAPIAAGLISIPWRGWDAQITISEHIMPALITLLTVQALWIVFLLRSGR
jgi:hypothetical protein